MTQHVIFMMLSSPSIQPNVNYTKVGVSLERMGVAQKKKFLKMSIIWLQLTEISL
jgi:hypothetical protein